MGKRLNIGLIVDDLNNHFTNQACRGAEIAASAIDANLFIIPGHYLGDTDSRYATMEYEYQYNTMFNLPNEEMVDIIYVLMGTIGSRASEEIQNEFLKKLPDVPVVILFTHADEYHSVVFDNKSGIVDLMNHFKSHGYTKFGYVSGPMTNRDACERLNAFKEMVETFGYPLEDKQIVEGDFTDASHKVVRKLLDINPDLEVIVFGNDRMAWGGYDVLRERNLVPGVDIFVAGFDDDLNSATMNPPLTTIKANSADLAYRAVLNADEFIKNKEPQHITIETSMVQRSSCGCDGLNVQELWENLSFHGVMNGCRACVDYCEDYLFGVFRDQGEIVTVKQGFKDFCNTYIDYLVSGASSELDQKVRDSYQNLLKLGVIEYLNYERFINIISVLQYEGLNDFDDTAKRERLNDLFAFFYRLLSIAGLSSKDSEMSRRDGLVRLVNIQTGELYIMSEDDEIHYEHLVDGFNTVGFNGAYIYLFQGNTQNKPDTEWKAPNTCLLKAYIGSVGDAVALPEEQQLIRTERIFSNEYTEEDVRRTMTVFPLFVGEDLYGLLVTSLDTSNLVSVTPVAYQLSVTLKSLFMIENQNKAKKELQSSLEQFMRDNSLLNKAARTDELTGLFNRRGFLEYTQKLISEPMNIDRKAIICYADMDNLKMVNDVYGHDEGDFSLKLIAKSLNEAFRNTDIIGRLGGDEFVAFAIIDSAGNGDAIKERLQAILKRESDNSGKEYPVEMSIGIAEFSCSPECDIYELLDIADNKLYQEKRERKAKNGAYR